jgi:hypothetical protein
MTAIKQLNRSENVHLILFLDVLEASYLLRVDPATVRRYIKIGSLEAVELPRNPQNIEEANGTSKKKRAAKRGYRIKKQLIADMLGISIDELNNQLVVYYREQYAIKDRQKAARAGK